MRCKMANDMQIVAALREAADEIERNPLTARAALLLYDRGQRTQVTVRRPLEVEAMVWRTIRYEGGPPMFDFARQRIVGRLALVFTAGAVCGALAVLCGLALWALRGA